MLAPKFRLGQRVVDISTRNKDITYGDLPCTEDLEGIVQKVCLPGDVDNPCLDMMIRYHVKFDEQEAVSTIKEQDLEPVEESSSEGNKKIKLSDDNVCLVNNEAAVLHSMDFIGIDTCSALSVSTEKEDFWFLDESNESKNSVSIRGVGGEDSEVIGRGPLVVQTRDNNGNKIILFDPAGVYLKSSSRQARLRIFGQQRMKAFGFNLLQNIFGDGMDFLRFKSQATLIPLTTKSEILMLETVPIELSGTSWSQLDHYISRALKGQRNLNCLKFCEMKYEPFDTQFSFLSKLLCYSKIINDFLFTYLIIFFRIP